MCTDMLFRYSCLLETHHNLCLLDMHSLTPMSFHFSLHVVPYEIYLTYRPRWARASPPVVSRGRDRKYFVSYVLEAIGVIPLAKRIVQIVLHVFSATSSLTTSRIFLLPFLQADSSSLAKVFAPRRSSSSLALTTLPK